MRINKSYLISLLCLVAAMYILSTSSLFKSAKEEVKVVEDVNTKTQVQKNDYSPFFSFNDTDVEVNYPVSLSYKTKKEVYEIRKKYVAKSIFASDDYEPSDEVFGMIADNKPWCSLSICKQSPGIAKVNGPSEEARFIVNPTMLIALEYPFTWSTRNDSEFCDNPENQLIPKKITYSPQKNEISVFYSMLPFEASGGYFYQFNAVNAADLGYKYAYADLNKSTYKPFFSQKENISNKVVKFQNFIHLGSSCGVEGGCNNGSPRQPMLEFHVYGKPHGVLYFKLWREYPNSLNDKADIVEKIIIENN